MQIFGTTVQKGGKIGDRKISTHMLIFPDKFPTLIMKLFFYKCDGKFVTSGVGLIFSMLIMYISIPDEENIFSIPLMKYSDIRKDKFRRFLPARWFFLQCRWTDGRTVGWTDRQRMPVGLTDRRTYRRMEEQTD